MKRFIGTILTSLELFSSVAWGIDPAANISFTLSPTINNYRVLCNVDDSVSRDLLPSITNICQVVMKSKMCRNVPAQDRLNCSEISSESQVNVWDTVSGCAIGVFESVKDLLSFVWDLLKWTFNNATSSEARGKTAERVSAIRAYLHTEYERAYAKTSLPFRKMKAMASMGKAISHLVWDAVKKLAVQEYREFGCLNYAAKSKAMCYLISDIFVPPAIALALIKKGPKFVLTTFPKLIDSIQKKRLANINDRKKRATMPSEVIIKQNYRNVKTQMLNMSQEIEMVPFLKKNLDVDDDTILFLKKKKPEMMASYREALKMLNDKQAWGDYIEKLMKDSYEKIRSDRTAIKDHIEVDKGSMRFWNVQNILRDRFKRRGLSIYGDIANEGEYVPSVKGISWSRDTMFDENANAHILQLDYVMDAMLSARGGEVKTAKEFFEYWNGSEEGRKVWSALFNNDNLMPLSKPRVIRKTFIDNLKK